MIDGARAIRCRGCGILNSGEHRECHACGTLFPARTDAEPRVSPSVEGVPRGARIGGVGGVFAASMILTVAATIAERLGVPKVYVSTVDLAAFALVASTCAFAARTELAPLLASAGGRRGLLLVLWGFGIMVAVGAVYFRLVRWFGVPIFYPSEIYRSAGWPPWTAFLLLAVIPGVFEELAFRGYVMARLDEALSPTETLIVQAALFSVIHLGVVIFPSHFGIGILLGVIRRRSRSLYPGMAVHMGWNAILVWSEILGRPFP